MRILGSGLILFQFQVNYETLLLFSWTVWCVGLSFVSLSVCVCLRANVDVICTCWECFNAFSSVDLSFSLLKGK